MLDMRKKNRVKASPVLRYWTKDRSMMISQAWDLSWNVKIKASFSWKAKTMSLAMAIFCTLDSTFKFSL